MSSNGLSLERGRIPSLDGLRALSIGLVILSHFGSAVPNRSPRALTLFSAAGEIGVGVFFVISGFLITWLLTQEIARTGQIDLRGFYVRRAYRIWPAYYALVLVVVLLDWRGLVAVTGHDVAAASLFVWNYVSPTGDAWWLGHSWSLSMEEQFYLLWPLCMRLASARTCRRIAVAIILLSPALRVATYLLLPEGGRAGVTSMLHTRADVLMAGCLLALMAVDGSGRALLRRAFHLRLHIAAGALLAASPLLRVAFPVRYVLPFGYSIEAVATVMLLAWFVYEPRTQLARLLDTRLLRHVGVTSFSLYLWQQVFVHEVPGLPGVPWAVRLVLIVACAELSYHGIELPFLRMRRRRTAAPAALDARAHRRAA